MSVNLSKIIDKESFALSTVVFILEKRIVQSLYIGQACSLLAFILVLASSLLTRNRNFITHLVFAKMKDCVFFRETFRAYIYAHKY